MIFVETSAWLALVDAIDKDHKIANSWFRENSLKFITSNLVIIESLGWIRHKRGKKEAVTLGKRLLLSPDITVERVTAVDEKRAWRLFRQVNGRGISMIDCTSFILMKRLGIKEAFVFDEDFKKLGFTTYP